MKELHSIGVDCWYKEVVVYVSVEQARVFFAEDNLPTVGLEASAEGTTEKRVC